MPYDEQLAGRIRHILTRFDYLPGEEPGEIKMFGGLCFTLNRKMLIGVGKSKVMIRLADDDLGSALATGAAEPMDFTGKPLRNFAYLTPGSYEDDAEVLEWIRKSARFVRSQPPSKPKRALTP